MSGKFSKYFRDEYGINYTNEIVAVNDFFYFLKKFSKIVHQHDQNVVVVIDNMHQMEDDDILRLYKLMYQTAAESLASFYCHGYQRHSDILEKKFGKLLDFDPGSWQQFTAEKLRPNKHEYDELCQQFETANGVVFTEKQKSSSRYCRTIPQMVNAMSKEIASVAK